MPCRWSIKKTAKARWLLLENYLTSVELRGTLVSEDVSHSPQEVAARRVGRPRTVETGGASLALLMRLVRSGIATTRSDLEREADLGRAAATDRLQTLQALGLIVEGDLGRAMGGRAPRIMRFRDEAGSVLAAVVDRTSLAVALTDLAGRLIVEHHEPADLAKGPEAILERLTTLFVWLLDERGGKQQAWGIGLSLPEPVVVDTTDGDAFEFLDLAVLEAWRHFDFESELSLRFGAPTRVHSSVQTMAVGEFKAGVAQDVSDFLFVKLDRSISAGAIMRGELSGGAQGFAGMIGHASTGAVSDRVCRCGNRGCLEALASGQAIAREGDRAARDGRSRYLCDMLGRNGEVTAIDVGHGAQLGDAFCAELLVNCGRLIGDALAPLANLLNPALIVLGGSVAQIGRDPARGGARGDLPAGSSSHYAQPAGGAIAAGRDGGPGRLGPCRTRRDLPTVHGAELGRAWLAAQGALVSGAARRDAGP